MQVPFQRASITEAEKQAVMGVLDSGWLTTGKTTLQFEKDFSKFVTTQQSGQVYSLAVNSNTSGMHLALDACGVAPGKKVITTPYTFVSTCLAPIHLGATLLFADTAPGSYNIDPAAVEKLLEEDARTTHSVVAIIVVHIAGLPCDMQKIMALAKKYNVKVIEDCAHSFPSPTPLGFAGTIGDVGVFSFYATKTITTAEGGMVTTRDPALAKRMATMRMHGMDRTTWDRYTSKTASWEYDIVAAGYKFNLPDILGAIGLVQLSRANELLQKRQRIVDAYNAAFSKEDCLLTPPTGQGDAHHLYILRLNENRLNIGRNDFAKELQQNGLGISVHFIPVVLFTYFKQNYPQAYCPNALAIFKQSVSLPLWPDMTSDQIDYTIATVLKVAAAHKAQK